MKAEFKPLGFHDVMVELKPETDAERLILAMFIGYDSNVARFTVERNGDGGIVSVLVTADRSV